MKKTELVSKCHHAEVVEQYPILDDGYSLGEPFFVCSKCHKPCEVKTVFEDFEDFKKQFDWGSQKKGGRV